PSGEKYGKWGHYELLSTRSASDMEGSVTLDIKLRVGDEESEASNTGNGLIAAFLGVLDSQGVAIRLFDYVEHTLSASGDALAAAYVELEINGRTLWGVGVDGDISTASLKAIVSAVNRALRFETPAPSLVEAR
ncbi:MAG: 2-isopropylmalate synthase, partial [Pontimonas sp.]